MSFALAALGFFATIAPAQVAEFSASGGVSRFGGVTLVDNPRITLGDGVRIAFRFTLNTYRFAGHEFGYGYAHTSAKVPSTGESLGMGVHSGFYDFLVYATPEGSPIRPFAAGGAQFSSFFPPGTDIYYGNQVTKFGFNYGAGLKFRLKEPFGARVDFRQYASGKPDLFQTSQGPSGWMRQTEVSAGLSFYF
ncbi:MAG: outer membrane beta-barrel protein [Acidobacteria bacterium]|nr:outer membrane beta-barrel protein [Acidobacteriota bacterium]